MKKTDIEFWALSVIDRVNKRQPVEDSRVELKTNWIGPEKAARRIAGHANAAKGDAILWLIGVDEKQGVKGVNITEFADWFSAVKSHFDGLSPDSTSISIPFKSNTIMAIIFETDRAPYVVKNSIGGQIQFEVPWRDATALRTANRSDLLRILIPLQKLPHIEVLDGFVEARQKPDCSIWNWHFELQLYVASMLQTEIAIPFHRCSGVFELGQNSSQTPLLNLLLSPPLLMPKIFSPVSARRNSNSIFDSATMEGTRSELIIKGPGKFKLFANAETDPLVGNIPGISPVIHVDLNPVDFERAIVVRVNMVWDEKKVAADQQERGRWIVKCK